MANKKIKNNIKDIILKKEVVKKVKKNYKNVKKINKRKKNKDNKKKGIKDIIKKRLLITYLLKLMLKHLVIVLIRLN